jgi:hypothetical protein
VKVLRQINWDAEWKLGRTDNTFEEEYELINEGNPLPGNEL